MNETWSVVGDRYSDGIPARLDWDGTRLTGDLVARQEITRIATVDGKVAVTPTGPWVDANLTNPVSAYLLCCAVLRLPETVEGTTPDLPAVPDLPDGAIA